MIIGTNNWLAWQATKSWQRGVFMAFLKAFLAFALLFPALGFAEFSANPYLYSAEKGATIDYVTFQLSNNTTMKLVKINGDESLLLLDGKLATDKAAISAALSEYYNANFYPSQADLAELKGYADAFNKSRNYQTRYGPAEKTCYEGGTFLAYKPCNDYSSCYQTASLVCSITGAEGCLLDTLATYILDYKQGVDKLNSAYSKFASAYSLFSPSAVSVSLDGMDAAFDLMKSAADSVSKNKLRFPESGYCPDCIGVCPEPHFDYDAISKGKAKIAALREKTAPYASLEQTIDKIALSTAERVKYREGEEKALLYKPKYELAVSRFGGLKAQAVEAKALVSDSSFVTVADAYLSKGEELQQKLERRDFDGFDALLSAYESSGKSLAAMINNSTSSYRKMMDAQDSAADALIEAQWSVNRLSKSAVDTYNSLAERKAKLDAKFAPPMASSQYDSLSSDYRKLESDAKAFVSASTSSLEGSVFGVGNTIGRTSVDGAMSLASSMFPISFKTRQSVAKYVPPLVLAVVDLALLALCLLAFVSVFYHFHGFFKSKIAISGWALSMLGLMFLLVAGSVGFYSIVLSTERFTTFSDFMGTLKGADSAAVVVDMGGADKEAKAAMKSCADQIESQLSLSGKSVRKYYIEDGSCTIMVPKGKKGTGSQAAYDVKTGLSASSCLDFLPDIPIFDLQYASANSAPTFTTVVSKQAIFKGNGAYYDKKPMCDAANVLN